VQEEAVAKIARELQKDNGRGTVKSAEWSESDGLLMFRSKIYVPNDRDLRCRIIEQHHDTRIARHAGRFKTLELIAHNYLSRYIGIYVKTCDLCNRTKLQGYDAIMNVIDSVTKRVHFIPMHTTITAEGATHLYLREVWKHHGTPQVVLLDRGSQFTVGFMRELYKLLGIKLATSTAYHPQTDGQTERVNQELEGYLRMFTS
jgi:hypothetical protein